MKQAPFSGGGVVCLTHGTADRRITDAVLGSRAMDLARGRSRSGAPGRLAECANQRSRQLRSLRGGRKQDDRRGPGGQASALHGAASDLLRLAPLSHRPPEALLGASVFAQLFPVADGTGDARVGSRRAVGVYGASTSWHRARVQCLWAGRRHRLARAPDLEHLPSPASLLHARCVLTTLEAA